MDADHPICGVLIPCLITAILAAAAATGSVDATIQLLAASLQAIAADAAFDSPVRIAIAAISESSGPTCWVFDTFDTEGPAFMLREMPFGIGQGELPPVEELLERGIETGDSLEKHAVWFFAYMRGRKRVSPVSAEKGPIHNIGGHVDFTVLRPDGVEMKRLLAWPEDVVGQKIEPERVEEATWLTGDAAVPDPTDWDALEARKSRIDDELLRPVEHAA